MSGTDTTIDGIPVHMTRCGYTGEDGFEISVSNKHAMQLAELLTTNTEVEPHRPLVARDSLRLECGMCLYGHELSMTTSPVLSETSCGCSRSAACSKEGSWATRRSRRCTTTREVPGPHSARRCDFPVDRALASTRRCFADVKQVGELSSGGYSPCLGHNVRAGVPQLAVHQAWDQAHVWMSAARRWRLKLPSFPFVQNALLQAVNLAGTRP